MGNTMLKVTLAMTMMSCALASYASMTSTADDDWKVKKGETIHISEDLAQTVSVFGAVGVLAAYGNDMGFWQELETIGVFTLLGFIVFAIRRWWCKCGSTLVGDIESQ